MKVVYLLSNRQRKDLLVRGAPIELALPAPPIKIDDPVNWARTMLPQDVRQYVTEARLDLVRVALGNRSDAGLTSIIGEIVERIDRLTIGVSVVRVLLTPAARRHPAVGLQWPADALLDGRSLLKILENPNGKD